jgi:hypothetical protein
MRRSVVRDLPPEGSYDFCNTGDRGCQPGFGTGLTDLLVGVRWGRVRDDALDEGEVCDKVRWLGGANPAPAKIAMRVVNGFDGGLVALEFEMD